jgi:hypothetical protein
VDNGLSGGGGPHAAIRAPVLRIDDVAYAGGGGGGAGGGSALRREVQEVVNVLTKWGVYLKQVRHVAPA